MNDKDIKLERLINKDLMPEHIAIIMDGNGRWAKKNGFERVFGHQQGIETVKKIVEASVKIDLKYLSLFAFSVENWKRPKQEIDTLMELMVSAIEKELHILVDNNVKLITIGNTTQLPQKCQESINWSIEKTSKNSGTTVCIALSYSGKWDIVRAVKNIAQQVKDNKINIEDINDVLFSNNLSTLNIPDPELLIRTSGEYRISNFFLWQCAYSELYFSEKYWPEFNEDDFFSAIIDFQKRERRLGLTGEQVK